jgi:predicted alpha/beta hydrolase family esterase
MKNAVILHGTNATSKDNWFPWLAKELRNKGYKVWVPDLPSADRPNVCNYNPFLLDNWDYTGGTVMIGHSSGATSILSLLNKFPKDKKIDTAILVAGFTDDLGWDALVDLFIYPFDWKKIKSKAEKFILIHSDDDPYVDLKHGYELKKRLGNKAELIIKKGQKHFSIDHGGPKFRKLPIILDLLDKEK